MSASPKINSTSLFATQFVRDTRQTLRPHLRPADTISHSPLRFATIDSPGRQRAFTRTHMQITREILGPEWHVDDEYAFASLLTKIQLAVSSTDGVQFDWNVCDAEFLDLASGAAATMPEAQSAARAAYLDLIFHPAVAPSRPSTPAPYTIETAIDAIDECTLYGRPLITAIFGEIYCESQEHGFEIDYEHYASILIALDAHRTDHVLVKFFDSENMLRLGTHAGDIRICINTRYFAAGVQQSYSVGLHMYERMDQVFAETGPLPDLIQHLHDFFTHKL